MVDNDFSVKEASKMVDCTTQNIYRQKAQLVEKGLMYYDRTTDTHYVTSAGINYLKEKRIATMKANNQVLQSVDCKENSSVANPVSASNTDLIELLKQNIADLKEEKEYWKKEYEKKDQELTKTNEHLQAMNSTVFQRLLATEEQNKQQAEATKKGFFKRLFG